MDLRVWRLDPLRLDSTLTLTRRRSQQDREQNRARRMKALGDVVVHVSIPPTRIEGRTSAAELLANLDGLQLRGCP